MQQGQAMGKGATLLQAASQTDTRELRMCLLGVGAFIYMNGLQGV